MFKWNYPKANYAECYSQYVMWWTQKVTFLLGSSKTAGLPHNAWQDRKRAFWKDEYGWTGEHIVL